MIFLPLDKTLLFTVDFGHAKNGLAAQVGYTIRKSDNTELVARTTTGVFEVTGGRGSYSFTKKFLSTIYSEDAAGYLLVVDTGEADADVKSEHVIQINFSEDSSVISGSSSGSGGGSGTIYIEDSSI